MTRDPSPIAARAFDALAAGLVLASQGAIQTLGSYRVAHTLEGAAQAIAVGPFAFQEAIKDLGNNGFTSNFEIFLELWLPFGLAIMFGRWVGNVKQGLAIGGAMALVLIGATAIAAGAEQASNPALTRAGVSQASTSTQAGGNIEGKAVRFGPIYSAEFATSTTGTSTGSVDSSHDSFTPIGGMVPLVLIQLGEITPGGVGAGLYGMLMFAVIAVFIAGLMVGRTPEYLESVKDLVEKVTGIPVHETLPDRVLDAADVIQFIDIAPEALRKGCATATSTRPRRWTWRWPTSSGRATWPPCARLGCAWWRTRWCAAARW